MDWREAEQEYTDEVTEMTTLGRMFADSAERNANRPAQMYKGGVYDRSLTESVVPAAPGGEYRAISYDETREIVRNLATGFRDVGVEKDDRVGIYADTRMEWAQTDLALLSAGATVTTVYKGSSESATRYLLDDPDATGVVCENQEVAERVTAVEDDLDLSVIVVMDRIGGDLADRDDVYTLAQVHDRGAKRFDPETFESWLDAQSVDDLASLIYTSGTTGQPKGVQLTHRNFRANVNQVRKRVGPRPDKGDTPVLDEESRSVSYLPLAHVFERMAGHFSMFAAGACVAYAESPDTLRDDFQQVRPTTATSVPRVYEKIYDAIREQATESDLKRRIFEWATDVGRDYHRADDPGAVLRAKRAVADRLVFSQVKAALGGNIDYFFSGGGSLSPELCELYHGMGLPILEGYGLTETSPVVTTNPPENPQIGTVGPPVVDTGVAIDESVVAEDDFEDADGPVGELLVAGPNVTQGYWNKPEQTESAFTESVPGMEDDDRRWFRTGDIMEQRPDGYLTFHERAKQILVLSTGKNVAPAPIEDAFAASRVVEQCMVVGDEEKFVAALLVPNVEELRSWAAEESLDVPDDPGAMCDDDRVRERVRAEVDRINEQFESYEQIKKFRLVPEEFTEDNGLLTPTMKKKRRDILDRYEDEVDAMYEE